MILNNEEERRAYWTGQALAGFTSLDKGNSNTLEVYAKGVALACFLLADAMEAEYRARLPATSAADGPNWSTAPDWAEWWAWDGDNYTLKSKGNWYECEPIPSNICPGRWTNGDKDTKKDRWVADEGPYNYPGDWRDSKIRRPR